MAFLTIASITVRASVGGVKERSPIRIGNESRAYDGTLRSTVRVEKREWDVTTTHLTTAAEATLRAAIALSAHVTCSGDMLAGVPTLCSVLVDDSAFVKVSGGIRRVLKLVVREV